MADPDDIPWTPSRGLVNAARSLTVRALIASLVWGLILFLVTPWFNTLDTAGVQGGGRWVGVLALPAVGFGAFMAWRLVEAAGFSGWPVTLIGIVFTVGAVVLGTLGSNALRPLGESQIFSVLFNMNVVSVSWLAWKTLMES